MILLMMPNVAAMPAAADNYPWSGRGTILDPYEIYDRDDLLAVAEAVNGGDTLYGVYFKQMNDIDLGGPSDPWPTIGITINNAAHPFRGVYNGEDFDITGMYVDRHDDDAGLFGNVGPGGIIRNVRVKNGYVSGTFWCAGIAARNYGIVEYCSFSGEVYGTQQFIAGVVGDNHSGGIVRYCCNEGYVEFDQIGGGVVGRNSGSTVENCYNRGDVYARNVVRGYAGGVAGENTAGGTVENCYTDGWVDGTLASGAVVGANGEGSTVKKCYYPEEMEEEGLSGLGSTSGKADKVEPRSEEQFASGEVAWELSQGTNGSGWGQSLADGDMHPHFLDQPDNAHETTPIYRVSFSTVDKELLPPDGFKSFYVDPGDPVSALPLPEGACWYVTGKNNVEFNGESVNEDIDLYAGKRILFAGEDGTIEHTLTYSTAAQKIDLDIYLKYAEGGPYSEGRFNYTITEDSDGLSGTSDPNDLLSADKKSITIPAGTNVKDGGYTLKITADEKEPFIMPLAIGDYSAQQVELNIHITIDKATPAVTATASDIDYGTPLSGSALNGTAKHPATGAPVEGTFSWEDGSITPTVTEAAAAGYNVTFTPAAGYDINYDPAAVSITVKVNKADINPAKIVPPAPVPDSEYNGVAEELIDRINPGSADGGTIKYWVTDDLGAAPPADNAGYSSTIPMRANAGTYRIWYKVIGDENHNDYRNENCYVTVTILPCKLTITEQHIIYNGENTFTLELQGVTVSSDDVRTVFATLTANSKNAGEYSYADADEPAAGQYTVKLSSDNYTIGANAGKLIIDPRPVVLKWKGPLTFVADNTPHTVTAEVTNAVSGDALTPAYQNNSETRAGAYTAKVTSVGDDTNYTLDPAKGAQNVEQSWRIFEENDNITLTVSPDCTRQNRPITYGDALTLTAAIKEAADESAPGSVDFYVNNIKVGSAPVVKQGSGYTAALVIDNATAKILSVSSSDIFFSLGANALRADYIKNGDEQVDAVTVFVDPKPVEAEISGETVQVYDGNDMASGLDILLLNAEPDDDVSITADSFTYNSKDAGRANTVTANNVMIVGAQSGNYVIKGKITKAGNIEPKPVKLEWRGVNNLVYTGDPANVNAIVTELIPGDVCTVTVRYGNMVDAGEYEAEAAKLSNSNYKLPDEYKVTYKIDPADLYIKSQTIRYNGTNTLTATADGVTPTRKAPQRVGVEVVASSPNVGDYAFFILDTGSGADDNTYTATTNNTNYKIAGGAILSIIKADPTFTAPKAINSIYTGGPLDLVTAGDAEGGEMQYSFSRYGTYYPEIPTGIDMGTYTIWYKVVGDENHNDTAPRSLDARISKDGAPPPGGSGGSGGGGNYPGSPDDPNYPGDPTDPNDPNEPNFPDYPPIVHHPDDPNSSTSSDGTSDPNGSGAAGGGSSDPTTDPNAPDDSSNSPSTGGVPNTGVDIGLPLYFIIMCICGIAVTLVLRKVK